LHLFRRVWIDFFVKPPVPHGGVHSLDLCSIGYRLIGGSLWRRIFFVFVVCAISFFVDFKFVHRRRRCVCSVSYGIV